MEILLEISCSCETFRGTGGRNIVRSENRVTIDTTGVVINWLDFTANYMGRDISLQVPYYTTTSLLFVTLFKY